MTLFIVLKIIVCISLLLMNVSMFASAAYDLRQIYLGKKKDRE